MPCLRADFQGARSPRKAAGETARPGSGGKRSLCPPECFPQRPFCGVEALFPVSFLAFASRRFAPCTRRSDRQVPCRSAFQCLPERFSVPAGAFFPGGTVPDNHVLRNDVCLFPAPVFLFLPRWTPLPAFCALCARILWKRRFPRFFRQMTEPDGRVLAALRPGAL